MKIDTKLREELKQRIGTIIFMDRVESPKGLYKNSCSGLAEKILEEIEEK